MPKVSIGLPVYNGENFLKKALSSILDQTFADFELIISDNASKDGTNEICEYFKNKDSRIKYYRNEENMGAAWNFNKVFQVAKGKYFKWAAHDDLLAPDFLVRCVDVLDRDSSVVLCQTEIQVIDESDNLIEGHQHGSDTTNEVLSNIDSFETHLRFKDLIKFNHPCIDIFGLIRRDILAKTPLIAAYKGSDRNLLAELGLYGRLCRAPGNMFFSRKHPERSIEIQDDISVTRWFDTKDKSRFVFPTWRNFYEYFKSLQRVRLSFGQKIRCWYHLGKWLIIYRGRLLNDVQNTIKTIAPPWGLTLYRFLKNRLKNEK